MEGTRNIRLTQKRWLPVPHIIEHLLPTLYGENFVFRVGTFEELGDNHESLTQTNRNWYCERTFMIDW